MQEKNNRFTDFQEKRYFFTENLVNAGEYSDQRFDIFLQKTWSKPVNIVIKDLTFFSENRSKPAKIAIKILTQFGKKVFREITPIIVHKEYRFHF
jgi:hypothetical protein